MPLSNGNNGIIAFNSNVTENVASDNFSAGINANFSIVTGNTANFNFFGLVVGNGPYGSNNAQSNQGDGIAGTGVSQGNNDCGTGSAC